MQVQPDMILCLHKQERKINTKGDIMEDTLKTTLLGGGTAWGIHMEWMPEVMSIAVGAVTVVYFLLKIKNELFSRK